MPVPLLAALRRGRPAGPARRVGGLTLAAFLAVTTAVAASPATAAAEPAPGGGQDPAVLAGLESPVVVPADASTPRSAAAQRLLGGALLAGAPGWTPVATRGVPIPRVAAGIRLPAVLDAQPAYVPQKTCQNVAQPGLVKLRTLLEKTYPGTSSYGINTSCTGRSHVSEHLEGRAFDWKVAKAVPAQKAQAETFLAWLTANNGAMARRLGIMYVMWDGRIWGAYAPQNGWRTSSCSGTTDCHRDHVHISMSWDGAYARTSFWTGRAVTPTDLGPCVGPGRYFARPYAATVRNTTPCPPWTPLPATSPVFAMIRHDARRNVSLRERGNAVLALTSVLGGETASPRSSVLTGQQLAAFQYRRGIPVTGTITPATWRQLALFASGGAVTLP